QVFGTVSIDGGATWLPNFKINSRSSTGSTINNGFDYGDYHLMDFYRGGFYRRSDDNSKSTGDNTNSTSNFDIYTAKVTVNSNSPEFDSLVGATINYGQPTLTLGGHISAGTQIPTGNVNINLPLTDVTLPAPIDPSTGNFSATFDTSTLAASGS